MKKNILLAEYDKSSISNIKEILSDPILNIVVVENGAAAKEILEQEKFDLMISAAMLPKVHGFELSQYVANTHPETKIILISGVYKGIEYKHQAITQYKANDFFEKPLNADKFKGGVFKLLNSEEDLRTQDRHSSTTKESIFEDVYENINNSITSGRNQEQIQISKQKIVKGTKETDELISEIVDITEAKILEQTQNEVVNIKRYDEINNTLDDLKRIRNKIDNREKFENIEKEVSQKFKQTLSDLGLSDLQFPKKSLIEEEEKIKEKKSKYNFLKFWKK